MLPAGESARSQPLPYPPSHLRYRVGDLSAAADEIAAYNAVGRACYEVLVGSLPTGSELTGKRVLDFGCGAGRTLRHFLAADQGARLYGCDIDATSLAWLKEHAGDRIDLVQVQDEPGLPLPADSFDLVYAFSVFTHLSQRWAGWLLELHRVLAPQGLLFVTFFGTDAGPRLMSETWDEDSIGMLVLGEGAPWDQGGPFTVHSEWWLREHWGRAFDVLSLEPSVLDMGDGFRQGTLLLEKRTVELTVDELERPDPAKRQELEAFAHQQKIALRHSGSVRATLEHQIAELEATASRLRAEHDAAIARNRELERALKIVYSSRSWRLTRPLRGLAARGRAQRSQTTTLN